MIIFLTLSAIALWFLCGLLGVVKAVQKEKRTLREVKFKDWGAMFAGPCLLLLVLTQTIVWEK